MGSDYLILLLGQSKFTDWNRFTDGNEVKSDLDNSQSIAKI